MSESASDQLPVVRVVLGGSVTSFRYPHFVQGVQPTYEMPPPSTIYGLLCAVTGDFPAPDQFAFGVHFTYESKFRDLEHVHLSLPYQMANPFQRELLFNPRLTLYLAPVYYETAFRQPYFPLALGRSQDLMTCLEVQTVNLEPAYEAYFEHTLLPSEYAPRFQRTIAATMAKFIDQQRRPVWGQYAILRDRVLYPDPEDDFRRNHEPIWVDPIAPKYQDLSRGVVLHRFV
jgi:CRISPR-associated protein Cas5t